MLFNKIFIILYLTFKICLNVFIYFYYHLHRYLYIDKNLWFNKRV